jgi:hypothetical protein
LESGFDLSSNAFLPIIIFRLKTIISVLAGMLLGYPQSRDSFSPFNVDILSASTVHSIMALGLIGGTLMGIALLNRQPKHGYTQYISEYTFMLSAVLSISLPVFYRLGLSDIYLSELFAAWAFGGFGVGILLGGFSWLLFRQLGKTGPISS